MPSSGGIGGTTFGALSSIGSDLSVSVSFNLANELLDAAQQEQLADDELIALVFGFSVIVSAIRSRLRMLIEHRRLSLIKKVEKHVQDLDVDEILGYRTRFPTTPSLEENELRLRVHELLEKEALQKLEERRSVLDFVAELSSIIQRIALAVSTQLLAASVRSQQPSRFVRSLSLVGLACFFVFVESVSNRHF